ncbi:MAG: pantoate--beta-alanine ligase [Bacteroidales bacterium]|nr:pantoate--beta-alanine ligase [Bacteroidales bacterium]
MQILNSCAEAKKFINTLKFQNKQLGFVPTMGALHHGHIALVEKAKRENDLVICSIYVNPLQFNNKNDFTLYPRTHESDLKLLEEVGCDIVFFPDEKILDGKDFFQYDVGFLDTVMEGLHRPCHFMGVVFIVKALFDILRPDTAYFGLKDYQQLAVIKQMVKDFEMPVTIIPCPTFREHDGLAMSSRNSRLTKTQRENASNIYKCLSNLKSNTVHKTIDNLKNDFINSLKSIPEMRVEYIEICDADTLKPLETLHSSSSGVACTAVFLGEVRLIDNILLF